MPTKNAFAATSLNLWFVYVSPNNTLSTFDDKNKKVVLQLGDRIYENNLLVGGGLMMMLKNYGNYEGRASTKCTLGVREDSPSHRNLPDGKNRDDTSHHEIFEPNGIPLRWLIDPRRKDGKGIARLLHMQLTDARLSQIVLGLGPHDGLAARVGVEAPVF